MYGDYGVIVAQGFVEPLDPEHNRIAAPIYLILLLLHRIVVCRSETS